MEKLKLAYSPCPNDTYIFGNLALGNVPTDLTYSIELMDVEELNHHAMKMSYDLVKMSYHAYCKVINHYQVLPYGSALGYGVGPLLISAKPTQLSDLRRIAIPGEHTTAHLLLKNLDLQDYEAVPMLFSDIENAVLSNRVDAGVIIHENRFTYAMRGLHLVEDLGQYWESKTGLPIPLGCIAIKRSLPKMVKQKACSDLKKSVLLADDDIGPILKYIKEHAQEMDESVMQKHIDLYVNASTRGLQAIDIEAINYMIGTVIPSKYKPVDTEHWLFIEK